MDFCNTWFTIIRTIIQKKEKKKGVTTKSNFDAINYPNAWLNRIYCDNYAQIFEYILKC